MKRIGYWMLPAVMLTAACGGQEQQEQGATDADGVEMTVFENMTEEIDPVADTIWSIGNAAIDDQANLDPERMDEEAWTGLQEAAQSVAADSRQLAALDPVIVTRPGVEIADEGVTGAPSPAEIQAHIQGDTELFRALAESLAIHADELAAAAEARDIPTAGRLINELDSVCESCHLEFWYPEQKQLMEEMGIATS